MSNIDKSLIQHAQDAGSSDPIHSTAPPAKKKFVEPEVLSQADALPALFLQGSVGATGLP